MKGPIAPYRSSVAVSGKWLSQIDRPVVHAVSVGSNDPYIPCRVKICDNLLSDYRNVMGAFRRSQPPAPVNEVEGMVNFSSVVRNRPKTCLNYSAFSIQRMADM